MAGLGLASVLLTGGIGLLALDPQWLEIKEAAVPGAIGLVVLASVWTRRPLVKVLLLNSAVINVARVDNRLQARGLVPAFEARLRRTTWMLGIALYYLSRAIREMSGLRMSDLPAAKAAP